MENKIVGIVCEYNPFHFGHKYHIQKAKEISGASSTICIMSGSFVQRGDVAIFDKWQRAKLAIDGGADLVIELPAYYALQSADNFALGAISILDSLKCVDYVAFGAETDEFELLKSAGKLIANPSKEYADALKFKINSGASYPASCEYATRQCLNIEDDSFFSPNNTLATAYISALYRLSSKIEPICVKRDNSYHSKNSKDGYMSASAIRDMLENGEDYLSFAPDYSCLTKYHMSNASSYIMGFFRNADSEALKDIKGYEEGLANLIKSSAKKACNLDQMFSMCVSKRYTLHRIRRFCICALLNIRGDLKPEYIRVLGLNKKGTEILKKIKQNSPLTIVTKASDFKSPMYDIDIASTDLASLCADVENLRFAGKDFLTSPYVAN